MELEEELRVVGNNLKSLEVSEEKVYARSFLSTTALVSLNDFLMPKEKT